MKRMVQYIMVDNEEEAADFLDRLDLDDLDFIDRETLRSAVDEIFAERYDVPVSENQLDILFGLGDLTKVQFPTQGIRSLTFTRLGKEQTRYVVGGERGLFGFTKAFEFFKQRK